MIGATVTIRPDVWKTDRTWKVTAEISPRIFLLDGVWPVSKGLIEVVDRPATMADLVVLQLDLIAHLRGEIEKLKGEWPMFKELVWVRKGTQNPYYSAECAVGNYCIWDEARVTWELRPMRTSPRTAKDVEDAKLACEADYERRMREGLSDEARERLGL